VREGGRIVSAAAIIAVAANTEGRREIVGLGIGPWEAETFWTDFLKRLTRRGLRGVKLVISYAHEGLKAAVQRIVGATWQRCRVHFMRNALAYVPKTQETLSPPPSARPSSSPTARRRARSGGTSPINCGPGSRNSAG
jgi:transposase-like protein